MRLQVAHAFKPRPAGLGFADSDTANVRNTHQALVKPNVLF
jgi:hypothetical protein